MTLTSNTGKSLHVAKTGKNAGQFVPCPARLKCRNNTIHISQNIANQLRNEYGEISVISYATFLEKNIYINSDTAAIRQNLQNDIPPVFFDNIDEYHEFVDTYGYNVRNVQASYPEAKYSLKELETYREEIESAHPINPEWAESAMNTLVERYRDVEEVMDKEDVGMLMHVAVTPGLSPVTRSSVNGFVYIMEHYNMYTMAGYVFAMTNFVNDRTVKIEKQ